MAADDAHDGRAVDEGLAATLLEEAGNDVPRALERTRRAVANAASRLMARKQVPSTRARATVNVTRAYLHRHARKESPDARRDAVGRMVLQEIDVRPAPVSAILAALRRRPDFPYYGNKSDFDIADVVQRLIAQNLATYQYTPDGKTCNLVPVQPYAKLRLTDPIHQTMALRDMTTRITKALHQREHEIVARTVDDQRTVVAQETTVCYPASMTLIEVSRMYVEEGSRAFFAREAAWKAAGVPLASMRIDQLFSTATKDQP